MPYPRPGKKLQKPRLALLLLVAFGILAQSLLSISGETHEFLLHADAGETYAHQHAPHQHHEEDQGGSQERGGLHSLLHQSCGGHCAWMPSFTFTASLQALAAAPLPDDSVQRIAGFDLTAPFRPPIQA